MATTPKAGMGQGGEVLRAITEGAPIDAPKSTPPIAPTEPSLKASAFSVEPDPYNIVYKGVRLDPYRIGDLYGITHPAIFQALKKILRGGRTDKSERQDLEEAGQSIARALEMMKEDEE